MSAGAVFFGGMFIWFLVYLWFDEELWEPHKLGPLREEYRYPPSGDYDDSNITHAAMWMNLGDE